MNEISNIHAFEDEDFLHACFVWGMAVLGVFAVCLVPVFMLLGGPADLDAAEAGGWTGVVGWIVGLAAVSAAAFAVHELLHAAFFKLLAPAGAHVTFGANRETAMIYACAEGVVYSRRRYIAICLAPTVILTAAFALGFAFGSVRPGLTFRPVIFLRLHNGRPLSNLNPARGDAPETGRVARLALPFHADLPANSPSPRRAPAS